MIFLLGATWSFLLLLTALIIGWDTGLLLGFVGLCLFMAAFHANEWWRARRQPPPAPVIRLDSRRRVA